MAIASNNKIEYYKDMGMVAEVFSGEVMRDLPEGDIGIIGFHPLSVSPSTGSLYVSGCCGSKGSFAHIRVTRSSVSERLIILCQRQLIHCTKPAR